MKCNSDCPPFPRRAGWCETDEGMMLCPNTPLDYTGTGVDEADRNVPWTAAKDQNSICYGRSPWETLAG